MLLGTVFSACAAPSTPTRRARRTPPPPPPITQPATADFGSAAASLASAARRRRLSRLRQPRTASRKRGRSSAAAAVATAVPAASSIPPPPPPGHEGVWRRASVTYVSPIYVLTPHRARARAALAADPNCSAMSNAFSLSPPLCCSSHLSVASSYARPPCPAATPGSTRRPVAVRASGLPGYGGGGASGGGGGGGGGGGRRLERRRRPARAEAAAAAAAPAAACPRAAAAATTTRRRRDQPAARRRAPATPTRRAGRRRATAGSSSRRRPQSEPHRARVQMVRDQLQLREQLRRPRADHHRCHQRHEIVGGRLPLEQTQHAEQRVPAAEDRAERRLGRRRAAEGAQLADGAVPELWLVEGGRRAELRRAEVDEALEVGGDGGVARVRHVERRVKAAAERAENGGAHHLERFGDDGRAHRGGGRLPAAFGRLAVSVGQAECAAADLGEERRVEGGRHALERLLPRRARRAHNVRALRQHVQSADASGGSERASGCSCALTAERRQPASRRLREGRGGGPSRAARPRAAASSASFCSEASAALPRRTAAAPTPPPRRAPPPPPQRRRQSRPASSSALVVGREDAPPPPPCPRPRGRRPAAGVAIERGGELARGVGVARARTASRRAALLFVAALVELAAQVAGSASPGGASCHAAASSATAASSSVHDTAAAPTRTETTGPGLLFSAALTSACSHPNVCTGSSTSSSGGARRRAAGAASSASLRPCRRRGRRRASAPPRPTGRRRRRALPQHPRARRVAPHHGRQPRQLEGDGGEVARHRRRGNASRALSMQMP